jgi:ribosomal protection tetracycline resistance protein
VLQRIAEKLTPAIAAMGSVGAPGTRGACFAPYGAADDGFMARLVELLADHDEALLAAYVQDEANLSYCRLRGELAAQTRRALVHPVFFGSAITGAGVDALIAGIRELLPMAEDRADGPVTGTVFKIERGPVGEKVAYVRLFSGTLCVRDRVRFGRGNEGRVTAMQVFDRGPAVRGASVAAGQIAKLWGLGAVQIGDAIGTASTDAERHYFAPPTLETVLVPRRPAERGALHAALVQLAEQDPLINLRTDDVRGETFVSLYGEVQKEVIQSTLADEYGLTVTFRETTIICVERPLGSGAAVELLGKAPNPFLATVGLRIDPAPPDSGVTFRLEVKVETIPLYVYKAAEEFARAIEDTVRDTMRQGLYGWQVTDCTVTMTHSGYASPATSGQDFRLLTPLVVMSALQEAGTSVCEPLHRFHLEAPADTLGALMPVLARLGAMPDPPVLRGAACILEGEIAAARVHELQQQVPALTRGEGVLEYAFDHYEPVRGTIVTRPRTDHNPLNRKEYLLHVLRRV